MAGILVGLAALIFAVVSKNQSDELREEFSLVEDLRKKLREIEDDSSGISAGTARIQKELDSLREGTQGALDRASAELTRMRKELNETVAKSDGMRDGFAALRDRLLELEEHPLFAEKPEIEPDPEPELEVASEPEPEIAKIAEREDSAERIESEPEAEVEEEVSEKEEIYIIRSGDTLSGVADKQGIPLGKLLEVNPDVEPHRLQIGQKIRLPVQ